MILISLFWSFLLSSLLEMHAQGSRTDINPALLYYRAFVSLGTLSPDDREYVTTNRWHGGELPERFNNLMTQLNGKFRLIRQAVQSKVPCDWGIDLSEGPSTPFSHLGPCKNVAQEARGRLIWHLANGREEEGIDDVVAAFVLGRNCSRDGTLISALVEAAIEAITCQTIAENFGRLSPAALNRLVRGLDAAPARVTMSHAIAVDKKMFPDWVSREIQSLKAKHPNGDTNLAAELDLLFVGELVTDASNEERTNQWARAVSNASSGNWTSLEALIHDVRAQYDRIIKVAALPWSKYEVEVNELRSKIEQSTNILVAMCLPALLNTPPKEFASIAQLAMVHAAAEYRQHGEAGLQKVKDPFGHGPFAFKRFVLNGVDRGFQLTSVYTNRGFAQTLIFVEKDGPPFSISGKNAGKPLEP